MNSRKYKSPNSAKEAMAQLVHARNGAMKKARKYVKEGDIWSASIYVKYARGHHRQYIGYLTAEYE